MNSGAPKGEAVKIQPIILSAHNSYNHMTKVDKSPNHTVGRQFMQSHGHGKQFNQSHCQQKFSQSHCQQIIHIITWPW
jgi:hypothetical protein